MKGTERAWSWLVKASPFLIAAGTFGADKAWDLAAEKGGAFRWLAGALIVLTLFFIGVGVEGERRTRAGHFRSEREHIIREALKLLSTSIQAAASPPMQHIRASVMLPTKGGTRQVIRTMTYGFEKGDADAGLEMDGRAGVSGLAWHEGAGKIFVQDLRQPHQANWLLTAEQQRLVRQSLQTLMATAIPDPGLPDTAPLLGTLQFDSDVDLAGTSFGNKDVQSLVSQAAVLFGVILKD